MAGAGAAPQVRGAELAAGEADGDERLTGGLDVAAALPRGGPAAAASSFFCWTICCSRFAFCFFREDWSRLIWAMASSAWPWASLSRWAEAAN